MSGGSKKFVFSFEEFPHATESFTKGRRVCPPIIGVLFLSSEISLVYNLMDSQTVLYPLASLHVKLECKFKADRCNKLCCVSPHIRR